MFHLKVPEVALGATPNDGLLTPKVQFQVNIGWLDSSANMWWELIPSTTNRW